MIYAPLAIARGWRDKMRVPAWHRPLHAQVGNSWDQNINFTKKWTWHCSFIKGLILIKLILNNFPSVDFDDFFTIRKLFSIRIQCNTLFRCEISFRIENNILKSIKRGVSSLSGLIMSTWVTDQHLTVFENIIAGNYSIQIGSLECGITLKI